MGETMAIYQDEQWLRQTYEEYKSIYKVAESAGCSYRTIHKWMVHYGIQRTGNIDRCQSEETKRKISESSMGRKTMLGKKHSEETRLAMSAKKKGIGNPNWKGGITEKIRKFRRTKEYVAWVREVLERAGGKCEECGGTESVEAHHKTSLYVDFSKALDLENGQALCKVCHKEKDWRKQDE